MRKIIISKYMNECDPLAYKNCRTGQELYILQNELDSGLPNPTEELWLNYAKLSNDLLLLGKNILADLWDEFEPCQESDLLWAHHAYRSAFIAAFRNGRKVIDDSSHESIEATIIVKRTFEEMYSFGHVPFCTDDQWIQHYIKHHNTLKISSASKYIIHIIMYGQEEDFIRLIELLESNNFDFIQYLQSNEIIQTASSKVFEIFEKNNGDKKEVMKRCLSACAEKDNEKKHFLFLQKDINVQFNAAFANEDINAMIQIALKYPNAFKKRINREISKISSSNFYLKRIFYQSLAGALYGNNDKLADFLSRSSLVPIPLDTQNIEMRLIKN